MRPLQISSLLHRSIFKECHRVQNVEAIVFATWNHFLSRRHHLSTCYNPFLRHVKSITRNTKVHHISSMSLSTSQGSQDEASPLPMCYWNSAKSKWGFAIYRTVYTPESDAKWPIAMDRLREWLRSEITEDESVHEDYKGKIYENFLNLVMDDKKLYDGLPITDVKKHFKKWLIENELDYSTNPEAEYDGSIYQDPEILERAHLQEDETLKQQLIMESYWYLSTRICIVVDEEVLTSLMDIPCPTRGETVTAVWLKIILDAHPYCKEGFLKLNPWYNGWGRMDIRNGLARTHYLIEDADLDDGIAFEIDEQPYIEI
ncbi:hypothetical protein VE01_02177 [Pseudogymnoascus verrucosus]|uniref:Uncharacterized protein n=1 Tax=Pseudogymnoascus verrucosus TaxID=342668 RepID=A0A1B8GVH8_9PEZI|nr:uncharacterized protein VE01_02177 [Pseudogymnoascus verrucosus]OBT99818.2 hypothetical protein VE01_02177 [Pseudogymnoascus verrucosus]